MLQVVFRMVILEIRVKEIVYQASTSDKGGLVPGIELLGFRFSVRLLYMICLT